MYEREGQANGVTGILQNIVAVCTCLGLQLFTGTNLRVQILGFLVLMCNLGGVWNGTERDHRLYRLRN